VKIICCGGKFKKMKHPNAAKRKEYCCFYNAEEVVMLQKRQQIQLALNISSESNF
jgi:hypothetical protein